jgi:hypothetical protein
MTQGIEIASEFLSDCCHHWVIESPCGPTSAGTCRDCGENREFKNSIQITSWESVGSHANRKRAAAARAN